MRNDKTVDVEAELKDETDAAWFIFDGKRYHWLPKSQVDYDPGSKTFTVPEWLAIDRGLA